MRTSPVMTERRLLMKPQQIKTVGFIGGINSRIARLAVNVGFNVALSNSRGPESLRELVSELGPRAKAVTPTEAAEAADIVVISMPFNKFDHIPGRAVGRESGCGHPELLPRPRRQYCCAEQPRTDFK